MPQLKRHIGTFEAVFYGLGIIIGAGIYVLIAPAAGFAGNAVWLSFLIAAVLATFTGLSYAELGSMFPKAAAEYVYVRRAYKSQLFAFMLGWLLIFTGMVSIAAVSLGFTGYFADLFGVTEEASRQIVPMISITVIAIMGFVNFLGIKETSRANILMTSVVIIGLLIIIALGAGSFGTVDYFEMPKGLNGVFVAASLIFFAYLGFEEIVNVAEETRRPRRVIPKAIIFAVLISTVLYVLTSISVVSLEGWLTLAESRAPLADAAAKVWGHSGGLILSAIALFAMGSTILGLILVTSRMMWGMARDGALPKILSHIHGRSTPVAAILAVAVGAALFVFLGDIEYVASVTSAGVLVVFLNINLALIWMRYTKPNFVRPFKIPLNIGKYPLIAGLGVFVSLLMLFQFDLRVLWIAAVVVVIGTVLFLIYKRKDRTIFHETEEFFKELKREAER